VNIYHVIQIKFDQLVEKNVYYDHSPTDKAYLSDIRVANIGLPTRWRRKPAGIDKKRNYVTVTLCIRYSQTDARFLSVIYDEKTITGVNRSRI